MACKKCTGKKVNIGVIGAGGIAYRRTIPGMVKARNCNLVAVMDVADNIANIAKEFKVPAYYKSEKELLADPAVQAVYIASPVNLHFAQIKLAAEAGKHILCEKPLTLKLTEAKKAVELCRKNKVYLQEGYMMKFHGAHQKIRELVAEGKLGKITYMRAQLSCWYPQMKGAWRQDPKTGGGGSLVDMATHLYDLLEYINGPVAKIAALTDTLVQSYKSEDSATTLLRFKNGAHATVDTFFCIPDEAPRTRLEIYGSQGAILTEGTIGQGDSGTMEGVFGLGDAVYDAKQSKAVSKKYKAVPYKKVNPYTAECEYFADCILKRKAPVLNGMANALRIATITEKAYASGRQNKILSV
jgi:predicted dehydrogenase